MGKHANSMGRRGQESIPEVQWDKVFTSCQQWEKTKISRERRKRQMKALVKYNHFTPMCLKDKIIVKRKLK